MVHGERKEVMQVSQEINNIEKRGNIMAKKKNTQPDNLTSQQKENVQKGLGVAGALITLVGFIVECIKPKD